MLKKLRVKFILVSMLAIALVLVCVLGAVNLKSYIAIKDDADELLNILFENNGRFPTMPNEPMKKDDHPHLENDRRPIAEFSPETPFNTRYFAVMLDAHGSVRAMNIDNIAAVDDERAAELAQKVAKGGKERGFVGSYRYLSRQTFDGGSVCLFLDTTEDLDNFKDFLFASVSLSILGLLIVALLVVIFSGIVMKPFAELYKKQKRFITDASHELKTPLTVISADCDILEYNFGKNEWTDAIGAQVSRLVRLTDKLVLLSRMDEGDGRVLMTEFSLSEVVEEVESTYQSVCEAAGKRLCVSASPALSVVGDQSLIKNLLTLLLDNAVKYSSDGSEISLSLRAVGRSKRIIVSNKVDRLPEGDLSLLFERFYRPDSSRSSESGGHGIGLSVAESIVRLHGGRITVCAPDKSTIVFTVVL